MNYNIEEIGKRVARLRKGRNMKQEELANELGIGVEVIGKLERGYRGTGVDNYMIIANYFHVSLDYLIVGSHQESEKLETLLEDISDKERNLAKKILLGILENI